MRKIVNFFDFFLPILITLLFITISIAGLFSIIQTHNGNSNLYDVSILGEGEGLLFIPFVLIIPVFVLTNFIPIIKSKGYKLIRIFLAFLYLYIFVYFILVYRTNRPFSEYNSDNWEYFELLLPNGAFRKIIFLVEIYTCIIAVVFNIYRAIRVPRYVNKKQMIKKKKHDSQQAIQKLRELKKLLDAGAIPQEVYEEKRKKYMDLI